MRFKPDRLLLYTVVITLAAFVAGGALALVAQSPSEHQVTVRADPSLSRIARLYYDGVNTLLASGESTTLSAHIGPVFANYSQAGGAIESQADLIADLQGIRSIRPRLRVTIEELSTSNDLVFASIRLTNAGDGRFVGLAAKSPAAQTFDEVLRIADGRVVERWAPDWFPVHMLEVLHLSVQAAEDTAVVPELRRWTIKPNGFGDSPGATWRLMLVETGSIGWSIPNGIKIPTVLSSSDGRWTPRPLGARLGAGDFVLIPAGTSIHFWNPNGEPAQMLMLDLSHSGAPSATSHRSEGITQTLLARGLILRPAHGALTIGVGQFWLPAGDSWSHTGIASGGEMAFVTDGTLNATAEDGLYWTVDSQSAVIPSHAPVVASGQALSIEGAKDIAYSASEGTPLAGWIMTFAAGAP